MCLRENIYLIGLEGGLNKCVFFRAALKFFSGGLWALRSHQDSFSPYLNKPLCFLFAQQYKSGTIKTFWAGKQMGKSHHMILSWTPSFCVMTDLQTWPDGHTFLLNLERRYKKHHTVWVCGTGCFDRLHSCSCTIKMPTDAPVCVKDCIILRSALVRTWTSRCTMHHLR